MLSVVGVFVLRNRDEYCLILMYKEMRVKERNGRCFKSIANVNDP